MINVKKRDIVSGFEKLLRVTWDTEFRAVAKSYPNIMSEDVAVNFIITNGAKSIPDQCDIADEDDYIEITDDECLEHELFIRAVNMINSLVNIVESCDVIVVLHRYHILRVLSDCDYNMDIALWHFKLAMRHELGHIVDHVSYIGSTEDEFEAWQETVITHYNAYPVRPDYAKPIEYFEWQLGYNRLPVESEANRIAGITEEDLAVDAWMMNLPLTPDDLGISKYISKARITITLEWLASIGYDIRKISNRQ